MASSSLDKTGKESLTALYERTGALILARCRAILGDAAEAEDALHDVFVRIMRYQSTLPDGLVPLSWLYRTAERCCFDSLRKRRREPLGESSESAAAVAVNEPAAATEAAQMLRHLFARHDPKLWQVAVLYYLEDLPQDRIAQELGWSRRTVGKKLAEIRRMTERLGRREAEPC